MVTINGTERDAAGMTVAAYLTEAEYDTARIVVEINGEIVPRTRYAQVILRKGDTVEIISFVGGG